MAFIELVLIIYFGLNTAYVFIMSVSGLFYFSKTYPASAHKNKIAVMIPAYKEDSVIVSTAQYALKQKYPTELYDVIVIADQLKKKTLDQLNRLPITVINVDFINSTKVKALNFALDALNGKGYEIAVVLDADNIMSTDFLALMNQYYNNGWQIIQGKRVAKNTSTAFSLLDGISESINNHIFRKGHNAIGLSASIIGSGFAIDFNLLKEKLAKLQVVGGFDRVLQIELAAERKKIFYLEKAVVYDEKTENSQVFENQRKRWLSVQFIYLKKYFIRGVAALFNFNFSYFNFSILHNIFLSRILGFGMILILSGFSLILHEFLTINYWYWLFILTLYFISLILPVPRKYYSRKTLIAIMRIPQVFFIMSKSLFRLRGADKKFIHTPHKEVEIEVDL